MIVILSPTNKSGGYHLITSFYGRDNIQNMIDSAVNQNKIKYIKNKEIDLLTGHNAYLSQVSNQSIQQKSDIVKPLAQTDSDRNIYHQGSISSGLKGKDDSRASYDPVLDRIMLGDNWDASSMLHELAHRQAQRIYHAVHSGQASPELEKRWLAIEEWLGVPEDYWKTHDFLGRQYQEQFAMASETIAMYDTSDWTATINFALNTNLIGIS